MRIDLTGQRFGRLVAISPLPPVRHGGSTRWLCRCDCGAEANPGTAQLRRGRARSCGCLQREIVSASSKKHGLTGTPEHRAWLAMWARCTIKSNASYSNYGGRGVRVCDRWKDFSCFLKDMGERPEGTSIDRIDNNGNYEPSNCRWASDRQQSENRRSTRWIEHNGTRLTVSGWARKLGIHSATLLESLTKHPIDIALRTRQTKGENRVKTD